MLPKRSAARDIRVENTLGAGSIDLLIDATSDTLTFGSSGSATGDILMQYDGNDGSITLDRGGLDGVSLAGGNPGDALDPSAGILVLTRAQTAGDTLMIRVYTEGGGSSMASIPIVVGDEFSQSLILFSDFADISGGGADFNDVGAIEVVTSLSPDNDTRAKIVETRRADLVQADLVNVQTLTLGGTLFNDDGGGTNQSNQNNGLLDTGETGVFAGVTVGLFRETSPGNVQFVRNTTTNANGDYSFSGLEPGRYSAGINIADEFVSGQPLFGYVSSTPNADPDNDVDNDNNGRDVGTIIDSGLVTLTPNSEPISEDGDPNTNFTVDFGFVGQVDLQITKAVDSSSSVQPGGDAIFNILVENLGPLTATDVTISDIIPAGLTLNPATSDFGTFTETINGSSVSVAIGTLAAGGTASIQLGTTIDANRTADVTNTASVSGYQLETDTANNTDDAVIDLTEADLMITKTDNPDPVNAGNQLVYTITVQNAGPDLARSVVATDILPAEVSFVSGVFTTGSGTVTEDPSGTLTITMGDLASGASAVVNITVNVAPDAASPLTNNASVIATPNNDPDMDNNDTSEPTNVVRSVDVAIDKTVTGTPIAGQNLTYTMLVTNAGPGIARGVTVTDVLDTSLSFVGGSFDPGSSNVMLNPSGQNLNFNVGTLAVNDSVEFSFDVTIAASAQGVIPNQADVTTTDSDSNPDNNSDLVNITVQNQVDLILEKSVDRSTAVPGRDQLIYTFTVSHDSDSPGDAFGVDVTDRLPAGLLGAVISAPTATSTNFDNATQTATVSFDTIPVGQARTFTITADISESATGVAGVITNPASVGVSVGTDIDLNNNTDDAVTTLTPQFDVTIDKSVNGSNFGPNASVTYTVTLLNEGPSTATNVVLQDDIPAGLTFSSGTLNGQIATQTGSTVTFPAITLGANQDATATLVFIVDADEAGEIVNTASVTADAGEVDLTNNMDTATITAMPIADVTVNKNVNRASALPGSNLVYTIDVSNIGQSTAANVQVVDTLPPGVTFVSGVGPNNEPLTASGGVVTVNAGSLAVDGSFTFTITAVVNEGVTANQVNRVTVSTDTGESNDGNNEDTAVTVIDPMSASIAGTVYLDLNNNGVQNDNEAGLAGVTLTLTGTDIQGNSVSRSTTTNENGDYIFRNLAEGVYAVAETQPLGLRDGLETAGSGTLSTTILDDMFTNLGLAPAAEAEGFNFGERNEALSKRRFLASS